MRHKLQKQSALKLVCRIIPQSGGAKTHDSTDPYKHFSALLKNVNHLVTKISPPVKGAIILGHALIGWIYCGALIGIGRQFMSMQATLVMHAIGAPLGIILISLLYFKKFAFTSPLHTAFLFLAVFIVMDVFVVAMLIEKSFAMFASPLGTWLPLALIFSATYMTGAICKHGEKH